MTPRRLLALAVPLAIGGLMIVTTYTPAAARPATPAADHCLLRGPIPVGSLSAAARSGCSLVGRMVTDGRVSVMVPPAGMSVAGDGVGRSGDVMGLTVTNTGTRLRAVRSAADGGGQGWYLAPLGTTTTTTTATTGLLTTARATSTSACGDRTFHLEHHKWARSLRYQINLSKMPDRFSRKKVVTQIRAANFHMRAGVNTCGRARLKTPASHYLGRTTAQPNINRNGPSCGRGNTRNVVGFGNLPSGLLGWTCYWYYSTGRMAGADMMLDNGRALATHLPTNCTNKWDFEGTVTHEWGHAYGMAHTGPGHPNLTMQHELTPCSAYARTLGLGDWLGMNKMYGHRR
ncbi:MAG TPA: hypothetical protein VGK78_15615 [Nocardioides sp.]|uniref:hypothetical protein n=1 Tax=Nocardioides sp. TaxID=35761 RepID=UPI002F3EA0FE